MEHIQECYALTKIKYGKIIRLIMNYMEISQRSRLQLKNIGCVSQDIIGEADKI